MSHIFISYSRKDIHFTEKIVQALAEKDLDTWIDWRSIPKGEDWEQEIYRGIEGSQIFIFVLSPNSARSEMCNKEIRHAVENSKRIVPIVICDTDPKDFLFENSEKEISRRNWILCRDLSTEFEKALRETIKTIQTDYEWLNYQTRLQVRALEWERSKREHSLLLRGKELQNAELQLAANSSKEPNPTQLQHTYVFRSRQATDRQRRITTSIASAAVIALAAIAGFGFYQAKLATDRANTDLARQLAAQAKSLNTTNNSKQMISVLLAIQSMKLYPSSEAAEILLNEDSAARPVVDMDNGTHVNSVAFSRNGKYAFLVSSDGKTETWEVATGKEIGPPGTSFITSDTKVVSLDGKYAASTDDFYEFIFVTDLRTGKEVAKLSYENASSIGLSPDGKNIVFSIGGKEAKTVYLLNVATGAEIRRFIHDSPIISVDFSLDGKYVVCVSDDGVVYIWEAASVNEAARLLHDNDVESLAFSPDGKYIATASKDGTARVWELRTGKEVSRIRHDDAVRSVVFSPDGKYVASGSEDSTARVWAVATGEEIVRVTHNDVVRSVVFSPDGKYIVTGSEDNTARIWEIGSGREVARMTHDDIVYYVAFSPDGKYAVSRGGDDTTRIWEATDSKEFAYLTHDDAVYYAIFSPDGKYMASGSEDHTARVWEVATGKEVARLYHDGVVHPVIFSPDGKYLASGSQDHTARVWDLTTGQEISRMTHDDAVTSIAFSPDGKYVVSGSYDKTVRVWEAATGREVARMSHKDWVSSVAYSPDGKYVVSGSKDETAKVWDAATGWEVDYLSHMNHDNDVITVAFSPNGKYVASGGWDASVFVWDIATGKRAAYINQRDNVISIAFSPDSKYILSAGYDTGTILISEITTGKQVASFSHENVVYSAAFSPDGKYVVSGSRDHTARVWEVSTGKEVARLSHNSDVYSVAFSPDGKYVVSGSQDRTVRVWMWQAQDLIADACSRLPRNLTLDEWNQYLTGQPYQAVCTNLPFEPEEERRVVVHPFEILVSGWAIVLCVTSGWIAYRAIFSNAKQSALSTSSPTWRQVAITGGQGGLLMALIVTGAVIYDKVVPEPAPFMPLIVVPIFTLPGLWTGGAYSYLTRSQSGKLQKIRRILLGSLAGLLGHFLCCSLLFLIYAYTLAPAYGREEAWLYALLLAELAGGIGGILSAIAAFVYVLGIEKWTRK